MQSCFWSILFFVLNCSLLMAQESSDNSQDLEPNRMTVKVVDSHGAASRARIRLTSSTMRGSDNCIIVKGKIDQVTDISLTGHTDETGNFELILPDSVSKVLVTASSEKQGVGSSEWSAGNGVLTIELEPFQFNGRLVDANNEPIANARINTSTMNMPLGNLAAAKWYQYSDELGYFGISSDKKMLPITIDHPQFENMSLKLDDRFEGRGNKTPVVMSKGLNVSGIVVDKQGNPISKATVFVIGRNKKLALENIPSGIRFTVQSTTSSAGEFELNCGTPGRTKVAVMADGYGLDVKELKLEKGKNSMRFELSPVKPFRVTITDPLGQPLEDCILSLNKWRSFKFLASSRLPIFGESDQNGEWTWRSPPNDEFELMVFGGTKGFSNKYLSGLSAGGSAVCQLGETQEIIGLVHNADSGDKVRHFWIETGTSQDGEQLAFDQEVRRLNGLSGFVKTTRIKTPNRKFGFRIGAPGFRTGQTEMFDSTDAQFKFDFELTPLSTVFRMISPDGQPAIDAEMSVGDTEMGFHIHNGQLRSGKNGRQVFTAGEGGIVDLTIDGVQKLFCKRPATTERSVNVVVVHPSGYAYLIVADDENVMASVPDYARVVNEMPREIWLKPWGKVSVQLANDIRGTDFIAANSVFETDCFKNLKQCWSSSRSRLIDGKYLLDFVPDIPTRVIYKPHPRSITEYGVLPTSAKTTQVKVGGDTVTVIGKLILPNGAVGGDMLAIATAAIQAKLPEPKLKPAKRILRNRREMARWRKSIANTVDGAEYLEWERQSNLLPKFSSLLEEDGTFAVQLVPKGKHVLRIQSPVGIDCQFDIEVKADATSQVELGELKAPSKD